MIYLLLILVSIAWVSVCSRPQLPIVIIIGCFLSTISIGGLVGYSGWLPGVLGVIMIGVILIAGFINANSNA